MIAINCSANQNRKKKLNINQLDISSIACWVFCVVRYICPHQREFPFVLLLFLLSHSCTRPAHICAAAPNCTVFLPTTPSTDQMTGLVSNGVAAAFTIRNSTEICPESQTHYKIQSIIAELKLKNVGSLW